MRAIPVTFLVCLLVCRPAPSAPPIYSSGINEKFPVRQQLKGWPATSAAIEATLRQWYGNILLGPSVRDGLPDDWRDFIRACPAGSPGRISIVYLASHQTPAAEWEFRNKEQIPWSRLLAESARTAGPPSLVILDACFAASVETEPGWPRFAPHSLFASSAREEEFEIRFDRSRPYDAPRRYPEVNRWLREKLGKSWDGHLSFLGLIWVQTFLETPTAPQTAPEWNRFLQQMGDNAAKFREKESRRLASTVTFRNALGQ